MKRSSTSHIFIMFIVVLFASTAIFAAEGDSLSVTEGSGLPGNGGYVFSVNLKNVTTIKGLYFTLHDSPDSLTVTNVATTARSANFRVSFTQVDGYLKVIMIPLDGVTTFLTAGDAAILNITTGVSADAVGGTKALLTIQDVVLADGTNGAVTSHQVDGNFWFGQKGDVVYNSVVDLFDVLRLIDIAISRPPAATEYERWAGDLDSNGYIDVVDIGEAIDRAVSVPAPPAVNQPLSLESNGYAEIQMPALPTNFTGKINIPVKVNTTVPVTGMQFEFNVDSKKYIIEQPELTEVSANMSIVSKRQGDKYKVLICGTAGQMLPSGELTVLNLSVNITSPLDQAEIIELKNVLAGTENASKIETNLSQDVSEVAHVPSSFALLQNSPNPFNMSTEITYDIPNINQQVSVKLQIFNMQGQLIRTLVNSKKAAGRYRVNWNGMDKLGHYVSSGVYFYKLSAGDVVLSKKMAVMK